MRLEEDLMSAEIALIGEQQDFVTEALKKEFVVHDVCGAPDKVGALRLVADRIRGVVTHAMVGLPTPVIEALPNLELGAIFGVGLETSDLPLAKRRGIVVTYTPVLYDDVADLAVLLAMSACRRVVQADRFVRKGSWLKGRMPPAKKFSGLRAGILGFGRIGAALAPRLQAFGLTIGYFDPAPKPGLPYRSYESAKALAEDVDILFLCAAGPPGGKHIVTSEVLEAVGPTGIFVNVARGWLVDEPALVAALVDGRLGAAALDVFDKEPKVPDELLRLDNVILTPHIASNTEDTMRAMGECVLENVRVWFSQKQAATPIP
jgi:hydroxypyruvate reductase